jgi:hypothetical protein
MRIAEVRADVITWLIDEALGRFHKTWIMRSGSLGYRPQWNVVSESSPTLLLPLLHSAARCSRKAKYWVGGRSPITGTVASTPPVRADFFL